MDEPITIMVLRAAHILSGVFWLGSITLLARYVVPASHARENDRGGVVVAIFKDRKLGAALGGASAVTVITGALLYGQFYVGRSWNLLSPGPAEAFGIGGLLALAALIIGPGYGMSMSAALRKAQNGSDNADAAAAYASRVAILARILMALLVPATILMAIARYL